MRLLLLTTALLTACNALASLLPIRWSADASRPNAYQCTIGQGETRTLECELRNYGSAVTLPQGASATMWYQTNGMADAWWDGGDVTISNNTLSIDWTPEHDCGAKGYKFTFAVRAPDELTYTIYGHIRMRYTPGHTPNEIDMPVEVIDFAAIDYTNAPWLIEEQDPIATPLAAEAQARADAAYSLADSKLAHEIDPVATHVAVSARKRADDAFALATSKLSAETDPIATPLAMAALPKTGGTLTGNLTLSPEGVTFEGVNVATNYTIKAEWADGDINLNLYEVAR